MHEPDPAAEPAAEAEHPLAGLSPEQLRAELLASQQMNRRLLRELQATQEELEKLALARRRKR